MSMEPLLFVIPAPAGVYACEACTCVDRWQVLVQAVAGT